jgi:hypothetical protein
MFTLRKKVDDGISCLSCFTLRKKVDEGISCLSCFSYIIARINDGCLVISRNSFANTWVHSRCFGGSVLLILCEHLGSFPVFWWIRVAHPLRAPGFIPGVLVDPCCSSFASTWVHSRCFGGSVLLILCEHMGSFPVFWWIRVAHPLRAPGCIPGFFLHSCCLSLFCTHLKQHIKSKTILLLYIAKSLYGH